jgi:hypothetical protein
MNPSFTELNGAYELAKSQIRKFRDERLREATRTIKTTRQGRALAVRHETMNLGRAFVRECEARVPELVDAHLRAGDRDPEVIGKRIDSDFLGVFLARHPGTCLSHESDSVPLAMRTVAHEEALLHQERARLARDARHHAAVKRSTNTDTRWARFVRRAHDNRFVFWVLIAGAALGFVTTAMSAFDITWADVLTAARTR